MNLISSMIGKVVEAKPKDETFLVVGGYRPDDIFQLSKYVVSLRTRSKEIFFGAGHYCGGTIINRNTILTAAHCTYIEGQQNPRKILVVAGTPERLVYSPFTKQYNVKKIISHKKYSKTTISNDIALLRLETDIELNSATQIADLPLDTPVPGEKCTVIGWGRIFENGPIPNEIVYGDLQIWTRRECRKNMLYRAKSMICAIAKGLEGISSCNGDSGGPLFCEKRVAGIVSFGKGCARWKKAGYYTNVQYFLDWIKSGRGCRSVILSQNLYIVMFLNTVLALYSGLFATNF